MTSVPNYPNWATFTLKSGGKEVASENSSEASSPINLDFPNTGVVEEKELDPLHDLREHLLSEAKSEKVDRRSYKPEHCFTLIQTSPNGDLVKGSLVVNIPKCNNPKASGSRCSTWACKPCALLRSTHDVVKINNSLTTSPARYKTFITLTDAPRDFGKVSQKIRNLKRLLSAKGYPMEFVWVLEETKAGVPHVHLLALSDRYIPKDLLTQTWGAETHISAIRNNYASSIYLAKGVRRSHQKHMTLNNSKAFHYSAGFAK